MDEQYRIETPTNVCLGGVTLCSLGGGALAAAALDTCCAPVRPLLGLVVLVALAVFALGLLWCRRRPATVLIQADSHGLAMPWRLWVRGDSGWLICPWPDVGEIAARSAHQAGGDCPLIKIHVKLPEAERRRLIAAHGGFARDAAGYVQLDVPWPGALRHAQDHVRRLDGLRPD